MTWRTDLEKDKKIARRQRVVTWVVVSVAILATAACIGFGSYGWYRIFAGS